MEGGEKNSNGDLDTEFKRVEGVRYFNPLRIKGQSVIRTILAWSVDSHDEDIFRCLVR